MPLPLQDVQDEILERLHAGDLPDRDALLLEHPEHASALRRFFALLDVVEAVPARGAAPAASGRLGDFEILREVGRGGMGVVYEARQLSLNRRVALKVMPAASRGDRRLLQRFRREAEAAARLRHPNLVPVYALGESGGAPFFAMELVDGRSLADVIAERARGGTGGAPRDAGGFREWAVRTVATVADALAYAHREGILHRDVKPANILLERDGTPRLTDFGLALDLAASGLTVTGEVFGSPLYMSPEQAFRRERPLDARTDVYSLAVTLHELLTGRLPYAGTTHGEIMAALSSGDVVPPREVDATLPQPLEDVLLTALAHEPDARYASAADFARDLRACLDGGRVSALPVRPARRTRHPEARERRHEAREERREARLPIMHDPRWRGVFRATAVLGVLALLAIVATAVMLRAARERELVARREAELQRALAEEAYERRLQAEAPERGIPDAAGGPFGVDDAATDAAMRTALTPRRAVLASVVEGQDADDPGAVLLTLDLGGGGPLPAAAGIELRLTAAGPLLGTARHVFPAASASVAHAGDDAPRQLLTLRFALRPHGAEVERDLRALRDGIAPSVHLDLLPQADFARDAGLARSWGGSLSTDVPLGVGDATGR